MFKYRKVLKYLNRAVYLMSAAMLMVGLALTVIPTTQVAASTVGTMWTTTNGCGADSQDVNHYAVGDHVYVNYAGFVAGTYTLIISQTDGAPPKPVPLNTSVSLGESGCFDAYTIQPQDAGHGFSVDMGSGHNDNYRVGEAPTATFTPTNTLVPPTATNTFTPTATATNTATFTPTATFTATPTDTATPTFTATPTDTATPTETNTPTITPNTLYVVLQDPYCVSIPGDLMQWAVVNNNAELFTVLSWSIDGVMQPAGFVAPVGIGLLTQTSLGTHTIVLYWEQEGSTSLEWTIESCQLPDTATPTPTNTSVPPTSTPVPDTATPVPTLPIPETGGAGGPIIPVTGADLTQPVNSWFFGGFGMLGFGLVLSGLRKMYNL